MGYGGLNFLLWRVPKHRLQKRLMRWDRQQATGGRRLNPQKTIYISGLQIYQPGARRSNSRHLPRPWRYLRRRIRRRHTGGSRAENRHFR